ncbi:NAD(P)H-binding protein [Leucobacter weissii]|uniref:NAD(P)H-binding protein n=1 Tax=Leucobacter weissii TaxID=1983706 RepID=A0A939S6C4_9MICO|nr:NAD(P)H-binding protein [Leucobacter weissii]MBO1902229.1 NAD(P)H-binding protein [Leucobacter weissii]
MSTIVVIGGTGYAGSSIVREAVRRGHEVVAVSRNAPADPVEGVRYEQGAAADSLPLIAGADVVVGALSPRAGSEGTLVESYRSIARAAADTGARLFVIGGFGSLRPAPGAPRFADGGEFPEEYAAEAKELAAVLDALEATPERVDWVFVSPAGVYGAYTPQGEPRGAYRTSTDGTALFDAEGDSAIEGADFALAVVDAIERGEHHRAHLHFAY